MQQCTCASTGGNTGIPQCPVLAGYTEKPYFGFKFGSDGTLNTFDTSTPLTQTILNAKLNAADPRDRWYPFPRVKEPDSQRADPIYQTHSDRTQSFIDQGVRTIKFSLVKQGPVLQGKLEEFGCEDIGYFDVDRFGNLTGQRVDDNTLRFIGIEKDSIYVGQAMETPTTVAALPVTFQIDHTEQDSNLRTVLASEMQVNLINQNGLLDVNAAFTVITTTGFVAALTLDFGSQITKKTVVNFVLADFVLKNAVTGATITITSVTENPKGTYTFVIPVQTSGAKLALSKATTKLGYDFTPVTAKLILIP